MEITDFIKYGLVFIGVVFAVYLIGRIATLGALKSVEQCQKPKKEEN